MRLQPGYRRIATVAVTVLVFLVLLVVGTTVRVPFVALGPGPTVNTLGKLGDKNVISIEGAPTDPTTGNLNLTTVSVTDGMSLFEAIGRWLSSTYTVEPRDRLYPPEQSTDQVQKQNELDMSNSESDAAVAALRYLHRPTKLVLGDVASDGPSKGVLRDGDQIVTVSGIPVGSVSELQGAVRKQQPGQTIPIGIVRGGTPQTVSVTLGKRPDDAKVAYLGAGAEEVNADPSLKIDFNVGDIGGPSAGMMLTLGVIDKLSPAELTHGKFIAGTGTIDDDGQVGPIGGITHKTRAARDAGATVFLVPQDNCAEAKSDVPDGLDLVKVTDLKSAITALDDVGAGKPLPHC